MTRTDLADVRDHVSERVADNVRSGAATALDTVKSQAAVAGEVLRAQAAVAGDNLNAATRSALDTASTRGKKVGRKARKRAKALAEEAQKAAAKASKDARKRADKAASKAGKRGKKKARDLSIVVQEKAGRHPRRKRRVVVFGGLALAGIAVATVLGRKKSATDDYAPVAPPASEAPGNSSSN